MMRVRQRTGTIMGATLDYARLYGIGSSSGSSILDILYGTSQQTSPSRAVQSLQFAEVNETREVALTAKQPQVARDIATFKAAVASAKDPKSLLSNRTVLKVLLTANGLGSQASYTALAQKALLSDLSDNTSVANTLTDTGWKTLAKTLDFHNSGLSVIQDKNTIDAIANGYAEQMWRDSLESTTPGLSHALTFRAEASGMTTAAQILGNEAARDVVTTALGIPPQIAYQELPAQEKAITDNLDIGKLKNPKFVDSLLVRYMIAKATSASTSSTDTLVSLAAEARGLVV